MDEFMRVYCEYDNTSYEEALVKFYNNEYFCYTLFVQFLITYKKRINRPFYKHDAANLVKLYKLYNRGNVVSGIRFCESIDLDIVNNDMNDPFKDIDILMSNCGINKYEFKLSRVHTYIGTIYMTLLCYYMSTFLEYEPFDIKIALKD